MLLLLYTLTIYWFHSLAALHLTTVLKGKLTLLGPATMVLAVLTPDANRKLCVEPLASSPSNTER